MIRLACPSCAQSLAVDDATAGTVCKCPACDNKFRVPEAEAVTASPPRPQPPQRQSSRDSAPGRRGSSTGSGTGSGSRSGSRSGARRGKSAVAAGVVLDELEVVDDEDESPARRKRGKRRASTPQWVYTASALGGVLLFGLVGAAIFFKAVAIVLIVIGLPIALMSRKWYLFGSVGAAYLLSGATLFFLHNNMIIGHLEGRPPDGASARVVDSHCARLLRGSPDIDGLSWVGNEKPNDTSQVRAIRGLIEGAYRAGATKVCVANPEKVDSAGLPLPDLVVVLPDDEKAKTNVLRWYKVITIGKRAVPEAGDRYLYLDY